METIKRSCPVFILLLTLIISACAAPETAAPNPRPTTAPRAATVPAQIEPTAPPPVASPTEAEPVADRKTYINNEFGLAFDYPTEWFGPTEYVSDQMLRLEIGSDMVYPYGTDPSQRVNTMLNSYAILMQYSKNDQNTYWQETYDSLADLGEGESLSGARSLLIKVRDLELGRFKGLEYISTLSETAQTEPVYARNVILFDDQSNVLTMMGQPINVPLGDGGGWRETYQRIDEANAVLFDEILNSIQVE